MSHRELDFYRLVVKPNRFDDWTVYDRETEMNVTVAQTKSSAIKKAKANAVQWMKHTPDLNYIGLEKRTKTGKKSFEVIKQ